MAGLQIPFKNAGKSTESTKNLVLIEQSINVLFAEVERLKARVSALE
jgi:hypothetical protein